MRTSSRTSGFRGIAVVLLALMAATGRAAPADERDLEARARVHYEAGRTLYRLGNYREALAQFTAGYELVHKPRFLLNLAQTFRKLGDDGNARRMIERYLAEAEASDPARAQAKELLDELGPEPDPTGAKAAGATTTPTTATTTPTTTTTTTTAATSTSPAAAASSSASRATVAPQPAPASVVAPQPAPRRASGWRRWGWILPVSVVVVAGVAVGAYFGAAAANDPCSGATIGCIPPPPAMP
jgi:hypothetical protein